MSNMGPITLDELDKANPSTVKGQTSRPQSRGRARRAGYTDADSLSILAADDTPSTSLAGSGVLSDPDGDGDGDGDGYMSLKNLDIGGQSEPTLLNIAEDDAEQSRRARGLSGAVARVAKGLLWILGPPPVPRSQWPALRPLLNLSATIGKRRRTVNIDRWWLDLYDFIPPYFPLSLRRQSPYATRLERYLAVDLPASSSSSSSIPDIPDGDSDVDRSQSDVSASATTLHLSSRSQVRSRLFILIPFFLVWMAGFILLVRQQYYASSLPILSCDSAPWDDWPPDTCGIAAEDCLPGWEDEWVGAYRCFGGCTTVTLGNDRWVGSVLLNDVPLVIGGTDGIYRADSWICPAAIHAGLISDAQGGAVYVNPTIYPGGSNDSLSAHGVTPAPFEPAFPAGFTLSRISQKGAISLHTEISTYNAVCLAIFTLLLPSPPWLFPILLLLGFFQIVLVSDPPSMPPDWQDISAAVLPVALVGYWFYRVSFRRTLVAFHKTGMPVELALWQGLGFWIGVESNTIFASLPITRLAAGGIRSARDAGSVVGLVVLAIVIVVVVIVQWTAVRRVGMVRYYLIRYIPLGLLLLILAFVPQYSLHIHHYMLALLLAPLMSLPDRISALFQSFALGWFLDGIGRWGWDSILETAAQLAGDSYTGPDLVPAFLPTNGSVVSWEGLTGLLVREGVSGWNVLLDDVLLLGNTNLTRVDMTNLSLAIGEHFFRLAYYANGTSLDYIDPISVIYNGTS